jgi:uncharacterized protein
MRAFPQIAARTCLAASIIAALGIGVGIAWPVASLIPPPAYRTGIDLHVHTAGVGLRGSGCFVSDALRDSYKFPIYLSAFGVTLDELTTLGDAIVLDRLAKRVAESAVVTHAVVLALDGVMDVDGNLDREKTQIYVPNEFVAAQTAKHPSLLFGASVNPNRLDALARLDHVKAAGAVLVKWIPGIMDIDPSNRAHIPFYQRLRALDLPLLTHAGDERSFGESDDRLGDPLRLQLALESGVTVIVAHVASAGENDGEANFERLLPLFKRYANLYTDISALTQINRLGYLRKAIADLRLKGRIVYGSDWPLQFFPLVSPWYQWPGVSISTLKALSKVENPWDRDVALKRAMGMPAGVLETGTLLIRGEH